MTTTNPVPSIAILVSEPDALAAERTCSAFMFCERPAIGWIKCITGAWLPCCARCASVLREVPRYRCVACGRYVPPAAALTSYPCGDSTPDGTECLDCARSHVDACGSCAVAEREAHED